MVGAGFAGVGCVKRLERRLTEREAQITLLSPFSYQLYLPLLPQVAAGVLTPQSVALSLRRSQKHRTRIVPGGAVGVDTAAKAVVLRTISGEFDVEPYDHLVLAPGTIRVRCFWLRRSDRATDCGVRTPAATWGSRGR